MIQKSMIQSTAASSSFQRPLPATLLTATLLAALALILAPAAGAQSQLPGFSKEFSPATIGPGSVSTLRFTITNESSLPVRNLAFTDNLPAGMTVASPARAASTCSGGTLTAPEGGGTIDYSGGGVGATSMCTITVDVTAGAVAGFSPLYFLGLAPAGAHFFRQVRRFDADDNARSLRLFKSNRAAGLLLLAPFLLEAAAGGA